MYIIKLNAIDSTNTYLKDLSTTILPKDYTVVVAELQTNGRGQMGAQWNAEEGKNLTASVFKRLPLFNVGEQFYISMAVSLAIIKALRSFKIPQLRIKWPNDILSANTKLCGILIENVIKSNNLQGSIIGFGLNVNQKIFNNLPQASSMSLLTGVIYNKDEVTYLKMSKGAYDFCFSLKLQKDSCTSGSMISPGRLESDICYLYKDKLGQHHIEISSKNEMGKIEYILDKKFVPVKLLGRESSGIDFDTFRADNEEKNN